MILFNRRLSAKESGKVIIASKNLPEALEWAIINAGSDLIVVIPAFSKGEPLHAELQVLDEAPPIARGTASPLALVVHYADGSRKRLAMMSLNDPGLIRRLTGMADFALVESDDRPGGGRRREYMVTVDDRRAAPSATAAP